MRYKLIAAFSAVAVVWGSLWLGGDVVASTDTYLAVLTGTIPCVFCVWAIMRGEASDRRFLLRLFFAALAARYALAYAIYSRHLQAYLGGDAESYDAFGNALLQSWRGLVDPNATWLTRYTGVRTSGWGMYYFVAGIYYVIGQNPLAIQLINCALGAGVCIAAYRISMLIYPNQRVARWVALMTAFSPSLVLWTSQGLKDGPIMLCLTLCILFTLRLRIKLEIKTFVLLLVFLGCLYTLRHYMSYIMFTAIAGALLFTTRKTFTPLRMVQGAVMVIVIGLAFSYFGAADVAKSALDPTVVQRSRVWNARAATSGFGGDVDITDPQAAIGFLPVGILYVLLAPFPWAMTNMRQLITLPELIVWWCLMPMMLKGYWFLIRHRLRQSFIVCTFVVGLTLAFALYQSNAGTAYRHRSQIYVFFFVFMSIGLELRRNSKHEKRARLYQRPQLGTLSSAPVSGRLGPTPAQVRSQ